MNYIELSCEVFPPRYTEIAMAAFSEYGFESFAENEKGFSGYIPEKLFNEDNFKALELFGNKEIKVNYSIKKIPEQNWNAVWESNFEPVLIGNECYIRAPFHPALTGIKHEIIIEPKMSFGTGHHETTHMMVQLLLEQNICGKDLLDMGCGTAVLAILAKKSGANKVLAIDNDEWAFNNAKENCERNGAEEIEVIQGDASAIGEKKFDLILANINRNVLTTDIPVYACALKRNGIILLSGFYEADLTIIKSKATQFGLRHLRYIAMNSWCAAAFTKE